MAGFGVVRSRSNISSASKWPPPILPKTLPYIHPALFKTTQSSEFWLQFLPKEWVLCWKDVKQIGLQDYSDVKCEGGL